MSRSTARSVFFYSLVAICCEFYLTFGIFFQPSWAKGWPGVPQGLVLGAALGVMAFLFTISLVGLTAPVAAYLVEFLPERWTTPASLTLLALAFFLALAAARASFQWLYANW